MSDLKTAGDALTNKLEALALALSVPIHRMTSHLKNISRCPHCSTANPTMESLWRSDFCVPRATPGPTQQWAAYGCTTCGGVMLAKGEDNEFSVPTQPVGIRKFFPEPKEVHGDIPDPARRFLSQAYASLHAPDACAMVTGSAVDAMLKSLGLTEGSVYKRITQAVAEHKLTKEMGEWAHSVRLGSNRPRHADDENPHVSSEEAQQAVEFADALAYFLFVLNERIKRGAEAALKAGAEVASS